MFKLKKGLTLNIEELENAGCNNGNYPKWDIKDTDGNVLASGITCRCGKGCSGTDHISDDLNYHTTDIERFRADVYSLETLKFRYGIRHLFGVDERGTDIPMYLITVYTDNEVSRVWEIVNGWKPEVEDGVEEPLYVRRDTNEFSIDSFLDNGMDIFYLNN